MIAYFDGEFNAIGDGKRLLEIGFIVCENRESAEPVEKYHSYIRYNKGRISKKITELTGITKELLNEKGRDFLEVYDEVTELINRYDIDTIYVWGNFDKPAMEWNFDQFHKLPYKKAFLKKMVDISPEFRRKLNVRDEVSLENMAYICEFEPDAKHHALSDAATLMEIVSRVTRGMFNVQRMDRYREYEHQKKMYSTIKGAVSRVKSMEPDFPLEDVIKLANAAYAKSSYPTFKEIEIDIENGQSPNPFLR